MINFEANMKKKWYVYEMNRYKARTKPETKARMLREFEDAVIAYADHIMVARRDHE